MRRAMLLGCGLALIAGSGSEAQTPGSTARALGMGFSYTATAEGYEAIRWNPALLAMPGRPGFSFNLLQAGFDVGGNTFTPSDYRKYGGAFLTNADKDTILMKIQENGPGVPLRMETGVDIQSFAATFGNFGISLDGVGAVTSTLSQDAAELLLFGNVTRTAPGEVYDGSGTSLAGWSTALLSLSYGMSLPVPVGALAIGATAKIARGIVIAYAEDINTSLQTNPFDLTAGGHALVTDFDAGFGAGSGIAVDLGGAYELASGLRFGLVLQNIVTTMAWDDAKLEYYNQQSSLTQTGDVLIDTTLVDINEAPFDPTDPNQAALRDSVSALGNFPTLARGGVRFDTGLITVSGDVMVRLDSGLDFGDAQRVSAGAELRLLPFLPVRAGLSTDLESSTTLSGGAGLKLGPVRLDGGASFTSTGARKGMRAALGVSIMQ